MFERESKRERILEARMREIRLKMKVRSGQAPGGGAGATDQISGNDQDVLDAETEFRQIVEKEAKAQQAPPTTDNILGNNTININSVKISYKNNIFQTKEKKYNSNKKCMNFSINQRIFMANMFLFM